MNKVILFVLLLVAAAFCGDNFLSLTVTAERPSVDSKVGIWWGKNDKGPVTVWFHGGMTSNNCEKGLVAGRDISEMVPEYTTVSVSACKNNHWISNAAVDWVDFALDSIAARRKSPVDSVILIGVSDGGLGVLFYSSWGRRPQISRTLISAYGPSLGKAEDVAMVLASKKGRWRFIQGGADRLYPGKETLPWDAIFCKNVGAECDVKFDPAGEHDWSYWQNKHKDWILEFFFKKPLTKKR